MEIWRDDVNAKGGLLGRQVEFVYYDDQTNPADVPAIYTKLLDVDKVDLVVSGYGTNVIAPAMPIVMRKQMVFPALFGLAVNDSSTTTATSRSCRRARSPRRTGRAASSSSPRKSEPQDHCACRRGCRVRAERGRRRAQARPGGRASRSSTTSPIRRRRPTSRRSSAPSRRPIPRWSSSPPTRRTPRAWCAPPTSSACKTKLFGGGMVGLQYAVDPEAASGRC